MTLTPLSAEFQRAFVAMRYFLGAREAELGAPLLGAPLGDTAGAALVAKRLTHSDRQKRAEALAAEVGRIVRALDADSWS